MSPTASSSSFPHIPAAIERTGPAQIVITWNNGERRRYTAKKLRDACPCATCREKNKGSEERSSRTLPVLTPQETVPLEIMRMTPIGNYAYSIAFSDGHDSGIFTFELLYDLGEPVSKEH